MGKSWCPGGLRVHQIITISLVLKLVRDLCFMSSSRHSQITLHCLTKAKMSKDTFKSVINCDWRTICLTLLWFEGFRIGKDQLEIQCGEVFAVLTTFNICWCLRVALKIISITYCCMSQIITHNIIQWI